MRWLRYLFMGILYLGMIVGLVYGVMETAQLAQYVMQNGFNMEIVREPFRGVALAALDLAVLGQSYVVIRDFIGREDACAARTKAKASDWKKENM